LLPVLHNTDVISTTDTDVNRSALYGKICH